MIGFGGLAGRLAGIEPIDASRPCEELGKKAAYV